MKHIKETLNEMYDEKEGKFKVKEPKKRNRKVATKTLIIEENPREFIPLTEFIIRKATGQNTENIAWYVDDMDLYMELFKYKNLDEACKEIYETKIAKTKISFEDENRKEEALKWIKGILKSLEGGS